MKSANNKLKLVGLKKIGKHQIINALKKEQMLKDLEQGPTCNVIKKPVKLYR